MRPLTPMVCVILSLASARLSWGLKGSASDLKTDAPPPALSPADRHRQFAVLGSPEELSDGETQFLSMVKDCIIEPKCKSCADSFVKQNDNSLRSLLELFGVTHPPPNSVSPFAMCEFMATRQSQTLGSAFSVHFSSLLDQDEDKEKLVSLFLGESINVWRATNGTKPLVHRRPAGIMVESRKGKIVALNRLEAAEKSLLSRRHSDTNKDDGVFSKTQDAIHQFWSTLFSGHCRAFSLLIDESFQGDFGIYQAMNWKQFPRYFSRFFGGHSSSRSESYWERQWNPFPSANNWEQFSDYIPFGSAIPKFSNYIPSLAGPPIPKMKMRDTNAFFSFCDRTRKLGMFENVKEILLSNFMFKSGIEENIFQGKKADERESIIFASRLDIQMADDRPAEKNHRRLKQLQTADKATTERLLSSGRVDPHSGKLLVLFNGVANTWSDQQVDLFINTFATAPTSLLWITIPVACSALISVYRLGKQWRMRRERRTSAMTDTLTAILTRDMACHGYNSTDYDLEINRNRYDSCIALSSVYHSSPPEFS